MTLFLKSYGNVSIGFQLNGFCLLVEVARVGQPGERLVQDSASRWQESVQANQFGYETTMPRKGSGENLGPWIIFFCILSVTLH